MTREILLTQGKVTLVDDCDFEYLSQWKWTYGNRGYVFRKEYPDKKQNTIWMHRIIMSTPDGMQTDHINGDRLDNRRCNLRLASNIQTGQNQKKRRIGQSGYRGVTLNKSTFKWQAQIQVWGKKIYLGLYDTREEAFHAYQEASTKHRGEFA